MASLWDPSVVPPLAHVNGLHVRNFVVAGGKFPADGAYCYRKEANCGPQSGMSQSQQQVHFITNCSAGSKYKLLHQ